MRRIRKIKNVKDLPKEERERLMELAITLKKEKGWGYKRIARFLGVSDGTVRCWLKKGVPRDLRFNKVNNESSKELSYVIGVYYGDGYRKIGRQSKYKKSPQYMIGLQSIDKEFVEEFSRAVSKVLGRDRPYSVFQAGKTVSGNIVWRTVAYSKYLYKFLDSSNIEKHMEVIEEYPYDFLRGFFDSEGSVYVGVSRPSPHGGRGGHIYIKLLASNTDPQVISLVSNTLETKLGIQPHLYLHLDRGPNYKPLFELVIYRRADIYKFYNEVGLTIKRKRDLIEKVLELQPNLYTCEICGKRFDSFLGLQVHKAYTHKDIYKEIAEGVI